MAHPIPLAAGTEAHVQLVHHLALQHQHRRHELHHHRVGPRAELRLHQVCPTVSAWLLSSSRGGQPQPKWSPPRRRWSQLRHEPRRLQELERLWEGHDGERREGEAAEVDEVLERDGEVEGGVCRERAQELGAEWGSDRRVGLPLRCWRRRGGAAAAICPRVGAHRKTLTAGRGGRRSGTANCRIRTACTPTRARGSWRGHRPHGPCVLRIGRRLASSASLDGSAFPLLARHHHDVVRRPQPRDLHLPVDHHPRLPRRRQCQRVPEQHELLAAWRNTW